MANAKALLRHKSVTGRSSPSSHTVVAMTEPDAETLADAIRRQERTDRDEEVKAEIDSTEKVAQQLGDQENDDS